MQSIFMLDIDQLHHHPQNPRKEIGDIEELTESIKQKGVLQNLTVVERPNCYEGEGYYVVIGNRRLEAAKAAGLIQLPCVIAHMSEKEQLETMLMENMQRTDLTIKEQADGFQLMIDLGSDVDDISAKTGFAKSTIYHRLNIAKLDGDILEKKQVTMQELIQLEKIKSVEKRNEILNYYGGTNSFEYMVNQAATREKYDERANRIITILEEKGIHESEKFKYYWDGGVEVVQVISTSDFTKEIPSEFETGEFYIVGSDRIVIGNEKVHSDEKTPEQIEEERKREERRNRTNAMEKLENRINREAKAAIISYATSREEIELTAEDKKAVVLHSICGTRKIEDVINDAVKGDDEDAEKLREQMIETIIGKSAITILLVACINWGKMMSLYNNWSGEYRGTKLDRDFVNVLKKIGLKLTVDEEDFVKGTSPLFTEPTE